MKTFSGLSAAIAPLPQRINSPTTRTKFAIRFFMTFPFVRIYVDTDGEPVIVAVAAVQVAIDQDHAPVMVLQMVGGQKILFLNLHLPAATDDP